MIRVLVTGATGFVGRALCHALKMGGYAVREAVRNQPPPHPGPLPLREREAHQERDREVAVVGGIGPDTDWAAALAGTEVVVHLAARVHVMREAAADPLAAFRTVNLFGTENLARQAARAGVRRLVYLSSIKVNGESTAFAGTLTPAPSPIEGEGRTRFSESDEPHPQDPYALSKWQAEQALHAIAQDTGLEIVILRPPLVYGPGVKGNFLRLLQAVECGIPLPFGRVRNARSLIFIGNLIDAIMACMTRPQAAAQTYLVCDGEDVSTPELISRMAHAASLAPRRCRHKRFACWRAWRAGRRRGPAA